MSTRMHKPVPRKWARSTSGTRKLPMRALSLSTNTGRPEAKPRNACQTSVSKRFCVGCGSRSMAPKMEPRCLASASRSSTCSPLAPRACSNFVLPLPVRPHKTMNLKGSGNVSRSARTRVRKARYPPVNCPARKPIADKMVARLPDRWPPRQQYTKGRHSRGVSPK